MAGQVETQPSGTVDTLSGIAGLMDSMETEAVAEESEGEEVPDTEAEQGEETEEQQQDESAEEQSFTIKHDGKEVNLKQSEILELAQKGFDYTNKTMAVAEERKALEPIREKLTQVVTEHESALQETLRQMNSLAEFVQSDLGAPPDISLAHYDAAQYIAQKDAYENRVAKLRTTYSQIQHLEAQQNHIRQSQLYDKANETEKYLVENLPGWKEAPEKSLQELNTYIKQYGLSPETTKDAYVEKGLWEIAHKAQQYDKLKEAQAQLKPKAVLPKSIKPSAGNQPNVIQRQETLKKFDRKANKSLSDLASILG